MHLLVKEAALIPDVAIEEDAEVRTILKKVLEKEMLRPPVGSTVAVDKDQTKQAF